MTSLNDIIAVINKINKHCKEIEDLEATINNQFQSEEKSVNNTVDKLVNDMRLKVDNFKIKHFDNINKEISKLVNLLLEDYSDEYNSLKSNKYIFPGTFKENENKIYKLLDCLNKHIKLLNAIDFDELVPPKHIEIQNETFVEYNEDGTYNELFDCSSAKQRDINAPKPVRELAIEIFKYCLKINACIDTLSNTYEQDFNIGGFNSFVRSSARVWLEETKAKFDGQRSQRFYDLFINENGAAIQESFFKQLENEGKNANVDLSGTDTYRDCINIGNIKLLVADKQNYLQYIAESPSLSRNLSKGYLIAPLILDLKKCGNILLNIDEDNYSEEILDFVNQLIMQFLVAFPANRITFCLIDIDNKMGFSQFKIMTKINTSILFNGIIRDDRQLENTIKDMEQTMYKVDDDILSYNSVDNIYEYNTKFEANPQNVHLFVLVNSPTGMRDDLAKRVIKIIQNGNRAGIFSIIVNNSACQLNPGYKTSEYQQFLDIVAKSSVVINKKGNKFTMNMGVKNEFIPKSKDEISASLLPQIVETLKENAEKNKQKVVPLSQMFGDTDKAKSNKKGIASAQEVLDIPIGARGGEIQNLLLKTTGDGSAHAVIIGGTGSGKSNLLHTIIMSACYKYSPEDLNLYLVDFKGGVEFKFYEANKVREKQIPHIKLTGLTSDLEDGVAILRNLQKELRRREDEFRKCRVEDIVQYRGLGKTMPRLFVIIDEIQELFEQDDKLGQKAIDILREMFKKGRAFGISILWASQNVPKVPGLKDKVLSQIGNRISLRLNDPDNANEINIDPKVVKGLNRPEKGLGVINDIRYGNDSIEFRVAYAKTSEDRKEDAQIIIDKWKYVTAHMKQDLLFIVGDDDDPSPIGADTAYSRAPKKNEIVSKSFDSYVLQLGQDYVTGKPFDMKIDLMGNKANVLFVGHDIEILRDMMGYSLLSVIMNQMTNLNCVKEGTKIYYANGEMINPKNSNDLFNVLRTDFAHIIEPSSSTEKLTNCIKSVYKMYKQRSLESDSSESANEYTPHFVVIHSLQRYTDLFSENPLLQLVDEDKVNTCNKESAIAQSGLSGLDVAAALFADANNKQTSSVSFTKSKSKMPTDIYLSDAFKELLIQGGKFGIHFIISVDNPLAIQALKNAASEIMYKVFVKGVNTNVVSQMLGDYNFANSLNNPKVALVAMQDERTKIRVYRYDEEQDSTWYQKLRDNYHKLME